MKRSSLLLDTLHFHSRSDYTTQCDHQFYDDQLLLALSLPARSARRTARSSGAMNQPFLYTMLFVLSFLCSLVCSSSAAEYGVGFDLALDYG